MENALASTLLAQGVVDHEALETAEAHRAAQGGTLSAALARTGAAAEDDIARSVARHHGLAYVDTTPGSVDPEAAVLLPRPVARSLGALPVAFREADELVVAVAEPDDGAAAARVAEVTGLRTVTAVTTPSSLLAAIEHLADEAAPDSDDSPATGGGGRPSATAEASPHPAAGPDPDPETLLAYEQEAGIDLDEVLGTLLERGGSDLHLTAGVPPAIRVRGELERLDDYPALTPPELQKIIYGILTERQREAFENNLELDLSYTVPGLSRFRVNVFQQREAHGAVMRVIPFEIKALEDLGMPESVRSLASRPRGFVLVTGPTGSGKSTTLASLIDVINRDRAAHIMTVEDPIEFLHEHKHSVVNQRELGTDTYSFAAALKHVLRQDPDVILVGEMRDLETIQVALTAAETGHLVFGTLHTQDAPQSIDRLIDVFPPEQQEQIRVMLGGALQGVVCQQLIPTADGRGRAAAVEVMIATSAIRNLVREGKTHQMYSVIQAGKSHGMVTMDQSLANLVRGGRVTYEAALERANYPGEFQQLAGRG